MFAQLNPQSSCFGDICTLYSPFLHQLTVQSALFEPGRLRPCPSYSRRRDRINLGLLRSLYKGGGVHTPVPIHAPARTQKAPARTPPPFCASTALCKHGDPSDRRLSDRSCRFPLLSTVLCQHEAPSDRCPDFPRACARVRGATHARTHAQRWDTQSGTAVGGDMPVTRGRCLQRAPSHDAGSSAAGHPGVHRQPRGDAWGPPHSGPLKGRGLAGSACEGRPPWGAGVLKCPRRTAVDAVAVRHAQGMMRRDRGHFTLQGRPYYGGTPEWVSGVSGLFGILGHTVTSSSAARRARSLGLAPHLASPHLPAPQPPHARAHTHTALFWAALLQTIPHAIPYAAHPQVCADAPRRSV